jgi:hypothetical protein
MEKEQNAILEAIDIIVKKRLRNLGFDYYVDGVITAVNISQNVYTVLINGVSYENIPAKHKLVYQLNDVVQVLIKNGNWKKKFIDGMANHTKFLTSTQYNSIDPDGEVYPMISQNDKHLWIGAYQTATRHHRGRTYISSGYDGAKGYETAYISVPNETNDNATNYKVMHEGNLNTYLDSYVNDNLDEYLDGYLDNNLLDLIYPVGSVYITSTKTDPLNILGGGTWTLIDKGFTELVTSWQVSATDTNNTTPVTLNTDNTSYCDVAMSRIGHNIYLRFSFNNNVVLNDTGRHILNLSLESIGVTHLTYKKFTNGFTDGGNAMFMASLDVITDNNDKPAGYLAVVDVVGKNNAEDKNEIAVGGSCVVEFHNSVEMKDMLDTACNRFYWKRKA